MTRSCHTRSCAPLVASPARAAINCGYSLVSKSSCARLPTARTPLKLQYEQSSRSTLSVVKKLNAPLVVSGGDRSDVPCALVCDLKAAPPLLPTPFNSFVSHEFSSGLPSVGHSRFERAIFHPDEVRLDPKFRVKMKEISRHRLGHPVWDRLCDQAVATNTGSWSVNSRRAVAEIWSCPSWRSLANRSTRDASRRREPET